MLSMLQQMLAEDKADMVREAVVKSLGIIMGYIDDPDKYSQVCAVRGKCVLLFVSHGCLRSLKKYYVFHPFSEVLYVVACFQ